MKQKAFILVVMVAILGLPLWAGGGAQRPAPAGAAGAVNYSVTAPITIEWWHAVENQYSGTVDKTAEGFNKSQNLITVEPRYIGSWSQVNENLVTAHAAGAGVPAISTANTPLVAEYGAGGLAEVLDPYIKATNFPINDFGDGLIVATQESGRQVALPFIISAQVMYYNKDMVKSMGVQVPTNWSQMDAFLKAAHRKTGSETTLWAFIIPGWDQWYYETFYLNQGINIINPDGRTTDLDSPKAIELAQQIKDWCDAGYIYWASGTNASNIMRQNFWDSKAFSIGHTTSLYNTYVDNCNFEVGMAWYPGAATNIAEIGGQTIVIPARAEQRQKNAAWKFAEYLLSPEVNMLWAVETGYLPIRKSILESESGRQFLRDKPEFRTYIENMDQIKPRIQHPAWSELSRIWMAYMAETINENMNVPEQMRKMAAEINEVLQDQ